jgi:hypothetical protein
MRRTSERRAGAADAVARRRKVDGDGGDDEGQGGASFPLLLPRGRVCGTMSARI